MLLSINIFNFKKAIIDIFRNYIIFKFYKNIFIEIKIMAKNNI